MGGLLIGHRAEAKVYFFEKDCLVLKRRVEKKYRHEKLDRQLRRQRTRREAKILKKALEAGLCVPRIIESDDFEIKMSFVRGRKLSESLNGFGPEKQKEIMRLFGGAVLKLHENNIIHADLTTSNVIFNGKLFIIDFGLSFISGRIEDKAVDLHLLKQALEAKHFKNHRELFDSFIGAYENERTKPVVERLLIVERRGRYKSA